MPKTPIIPLHTHDGDGPDDVRRIREAIQELILRMELLLTGIAPRPEAVVEALMAAAHAVMPDSDAAFLPSVSVARCAVCGAEYDIRRSGRIICHPCQLARIHAALHGAAPSPSRSHITMLSSEDDVRSAVVAMCQTADTAHWVGGSYYGDEAMAERMADVAMAIVEKQLDECRDVMVDAVVAAARAHPDIAGLAESLRRP